MKRGIFFRGRGQYTLHWEENVDLEAFLSGVVCAPFPYIPFCLSLWVTVLVCIGSSYVRDKEAAEASGIAQIAC